MLPKLPTIEEAGRLMRHKELTPLDLVEHCLGRIAQFEDRIHAWVLVDEEGARKEAKRQTDMLARGEDLGPLHGIPIGIKDIIDVAGWQTKCGSKLRENVAPAEKDATVVASLRKAGAIILGKTVTTEFACFDPPPTRNPWNLDHTPGGSSSGSAAAVAMEMCMAALGTQTGGSIIRPAAYCGVCGFKPSFSFVGSFDGRDEGVMPLTLHLDHVGPIARSVTDLDLVTKVILHRDDALWSANWEYATRPRLAFCERFFQENSSAEVWNVFTGAMGRLREHGLVIEQVETPQGFESVHAMHRLIMAAEAAAVHRREFARRSNDYSPHVARLIDEGLRITAIDYAEALFHRHRFSRDLWQWFEADVSQTIDAVLIPATPTVAPTTETTGDPKFNSPWSYAGTPSAIIPIGVTGSGLPVGMQILGQWGGFNEQTLAVTKYCQPIVGSNERPPLLEESS